jgi:dihydroneopterin aldolase
MLSPVLFCCSEIQQVVEGPAKVLQEAVAEEAAQRLLALDKRVAAVQLYIRKPHVALPGVLDSIGTCENGMSAED